MPDISVIIPCHNVADYIDRCLESITSQTIGCAALEIICVDDCSTDDTVEKLSVWEKNYPENICLVCLDRNGRQGRARNIGMGYATGEWTAFIDADDWVEKDYFERLYSRAETGRYDIVICGNMRDDGSSGLYAADRGGDPDRELVIDSTAARKKLIKENTLKFAAWGRLIKRSFLTENGIYFPEGLAYEDIFWGELVNFYARSVYISGEKLYHYFVNTSSTVLTKGGEYHPDMLTVNSLLWMELKKRGFLEEYRDELEYELIYNGILAFLKVLAYRYEEAPYSLYRLLGAFAAEHIPDYRDNPYFMAKEFPAFHRDLCDAVFMNMDRQSFNEFIEYVRKIGL
ncbi:MAG: glycosyltransferase family 2 protein [Lachnospiraceae bacterium]|nr:glycosyltransferase family 2 protein [Lachnospiraceae bacterium]